MATRPPTHPNRPNAGSFGGRSTEFSGRKPLPTPKSPTRAHQQRMGRKSQRGK